MKKTLLRVKAFTLIELLVVITIIGILASLAIPTIGAALDKANQTKDVNNVKQTGTIMFMAANDDNGLFNTNSSPKDAFTDLYNNGVLTTLTVLAGTGQKPAPTVAELKTTGGVTRNIAWGYNSGLTTSANPGTVLLMSFGSNYDGSANTNAVTPNPTPLTGSLWGSKGVVAYYVGGNAKFLKTTGTGTAKSVQVIESPSVTVGSFKDE